MNPFAILESNLNQFRLLTVTGGVDSKANDRSTRRVSTYGRQRDCGVHVPTSAGDGQWCRSPGRCANSTAGGVCDTDGLAGGHSITQQHQPLASNASHHKPIDDDEEEEDDDDEEDDDFHTVAGDLATEMEEAAAAERNEESNGALVGALVSLEKSINAQCQLMNKRLNKDRWALKSAADATRAPVLGSALPKVATRTDKVSQSAT